MSGPARRPSRLSGLGRTVRIVLVFLFVVGTLASAGAGYILYSEITANLPDVESLTQYRPPMVTQVLADDGTVMGEFYLEKRYLVPFERIPAMVRNAFLAAEDDGFYRHGGIDFVSVGRAFLSNLAAGQKVQGGSTITQQVVKQILLSPQKSYERKIKEMILALRLERQLTKDQILWLYLNNLYLGSGVYGVGAAAREYFGKNVEQLTLAEAALLAGLPQAPSRYSPVKNWALAKGRQRYVLERMAEVGFITAAEAGAALREPLSLAPHRSNFVAAPYYVEQVRRLLEERYGQTGLYALGLRVHTPASLRLQAMAETALRDGLEDLTKRQGYGDTIRRLDAKELEAFTREQTEALKGRGLEAERLYDAVVTAVSSGKRSVTVHLQVGPFHGQLAPPGDNNCRRRAGHRVGDVIRVRLTEASSDGTTQFDCTDSPPVQGALVAMEPSTGDVKALVGGFDFEDSQFNRAVQSLRQPGSAFKPFIYAAALDRDFTPASVIVDEPISFRANGRVWTPQNYDNRYHGPTTLRDALTFSRNVVTVKLAMKVGLSYLVSYIPKLGIHTPLSKNLSLALGASEVTPLELTAAYGTFANLGRRAEPRFITRITDNQGNVIDEHLPDTEQVIAPETAYQMTSMLESVVQRGTGRRAADLGRPAAGKTGTTNDVNDAWFIGYTPQLLAGVWVGFDEKRSLGRGETGGHVATPIWTEFMEAALEGQPVLDFPVPDGIRCSLVRSGRLECFRRGTEPAAAVAQAPSHQPPPPPAREFTNEDLTHYD